MTGKSFNAFYNRMATTPGNIGSLEFEMLPGSTGYAVFRSFMFHKVV